MPIYCDIHESAKTQAMAIKKLNATVKSMKVGDLVNTENGSVIELKEITDYHGSIRGTKEKPGRMYAQVYNMKINYPHTFVIVYGDFKKLQYRPETRGFSMAQFLGSMSSIECRKVERIDQPGTYYDKTCVNWVQNKSQAFTLAKSLLDKADKLAKPIDLVTRARPTKGNFVTSCLQMVPRLGVKKAEDIVEFHNLNKVSKLTALTREQLMEVPGIGPKQSDAIKMWFS